MNHTCKKSDLKYITLTEALQQLEHTGGQLVHIYAGPGDDHCIQFLQGTSQILASCCCYTSEYLPHWHSVFFTSMVACAVWPAVVRDSTAAHKSGGSGKSSAADVQLGTGPCQYALHLDNRDPLYMYIFLE
eukprot:scaffold109683_cov19-Tisochrysis_lutea.AAC.2